MIIKYQEGGWLKTLASDVTKTYGGAGDGSSIANFIGSQMAQSGGNSNGYWGNGGAEAVGGVVSKAPELLKNIKAGGGVGWGAAMNAAASLIDPMVKEGTTESGEYGDLTKKIDGFYDKGADVLLNSGNPLGMVIGGAMKLNAVAGDAISNQSINGRALGTSGNTKSDAILGSAFFESNLGALNAYFGEDMNELEYDKKAWNTVGSSYKGSQKSVKDASDNTGGRYGWLSTVTGEYQKDLAQNLEADRQQTLVSKISDEATEANERASSTILEANLNQLKKLQGLGFTFRVQNGMKLPTKQDIQKTKKLFEEPETGLPPFAPDYSILFKLEDTIEEINFFKEGGKMNIIPEGELHARLHHMELEGITKKGIPVISEEEGGEIIQHAEIERNEIIFRLEVTKKLEELMEDGSEEAALEAGKLLADEILNNTEDRTGLLNEVE